MLPSWHEGMANTNLECAAMGRPVITSNIHGCLEAVEDGISGYLAERKNADDLYKKMKLMCELSSEKRKAMGMAGRERMEVIFDKILIICTSVGDKQYYCQQLLIRLMVGGCREGLRAVRLWRRLEVTVRL